MKTVYVLVECDPYLKRNITGIEFIFENKEQAEECLYLYDSLFYDHPYTIQEFEVLSFKKGKETIRHVSSLKQRHTTIEKEITKTLSNENE